MSESVYPITAVAQTATAALGLPAPAAAAQPPIPEIAADLAGVARVAVLAPDALGLSVLRRWQKAMPFLMSLHKERHLVLRSVPPPITPVNFAAMVTGAGLESHGLDDYSGSLACESVFDVVRASGGVSAGVGQPNYTGGEFLARYADLSGRTEEPGDEAVTAMILRLAQERRPDYLIAQLGDPDTVFHRVGVSSRDAGAVVQATDAQLRRLVKELIELAYGIIILSDHGQHEYPAPGGQGGFRGGHDGSGGDEDYLVPCTWVR